MTQIQMQRTLLIGLGEAGARIADGLLGELNRWLGQVGIVQGVAVLSAEMALDNIEANLRLSPEAALESWQPDFEAQVDSALRQISQLNQVARLSQQGVTLHRQDEIHLILVADLAEAWVQPALPALAATVRAVVERRLACYVGLTGMLLDTGPAESVEPTPASSGRYHPPVKSIPFACRPADQFDRGCFVASLTNEAGLIIGDVDQLIRHTVFFLTVLLRQVRVSGIDWEEERAGGWGPSLTSFGLAAVRWPGRQLAGILSRRWALAVLKQMVTLPPPRSGTPDLARQAREVVQQWVTGQELAPPLLLDRLAALMPPLPNQLPGLAPDPPWPWLLLDTQASIEQACQSWESNWLAVCRDKVKETLADLERAWPQQVEMWLAEQVAARRSGRVLAAQSYMAAISEIWQAFVEGVEQKLEEAEAELAALDRQLGQTAARLADTLADFPASPLSALFYWGRWPVRWPHYWAKCRQAQTMARNFAHLNRGRLIAWQMVSFYEEVLPFYRRLMAEWQQVVARWRQSCQQVVEASNSDSLAEWPGQLESCLLGSTGPWSEEMVTTLYQTATAEQQASLWEQIGPLGEWVREGVEAGTIVERVCDLALTLLLSHVAMPVDEALRRQWPDEKALADWLAGLAEQARPFWRFDETVLRESARSQARLETWLLLPGGADSRLAQIGQSWSPAPLTVPSRDPEALAVITMRRMNQAEFELDEDSMGD